MENETLKQEKARKLRYRKPAVKGMNIWDIRNALEEICENAQNIMYFWDTDEETVINALCGDEDDANEFRMEFSDLEAEAERMLDDLAYADVTKYFDDFFSVTLGGEHESMLGYDSYEQDYMPIEPWENSFATTEAEKRLEKLTKETLLNVTGQCLAIFRNFLSLQTRAASLEAAMEILKDKNTQVLGNARKINELYENYERSYHGSRESWQLEEAANLMPSEAWIA